MHAFRRNALRTVRDPVRGQPKRGRHRRESITAKLPGRLPYRKRQTGLALGGSPKKVLPELDLVRPFEHFELFVGVEDHLK